MRSRPLLLSDDVAADDITYTPLYCMCFEEKLGQNKQKTHFLTGKDSCTGVYG